MADSFLKTITGFLALPIVGIICALLLLEVAVRLWWVSDAPIKTSSVVVYEDSGQALIDRVSGFRAKHPPTLAKDKYRIVVVGDSFTYGLHLKVEDTWPYLAEQLLNDSGEGVELINGGFPGADTQDEYDRFLAKQLKYRPDEVWIMFLINDYTSLCSNCGPVRLKEKLERAAAHPTGIAKYSHLVRFFKLQRLERKMTSQTVERYLRPYNTENSDYKKCVQGFRKFKSLADNHGFVLRVFIYPMLYELDQNHPFLPAHKKIQAELAEIGVETHDLTIAFWGKNAEALWVKPNDSHPNRDANLVIAKRLLMLEEQGSLY